MASIRISLPRLAFEANLRQLVEQMGQADGCCSVEIDFSRVEYYIPAAIVAVIAKLKWWETQGTAWQLVNYDQNPVFTYFQRMNFCTILGVDIPENFSRHDPQDNFVPIIAVPAADHDVAPVASRVAACVDPSRGEPFKLLEFASSEVILNARQHSGGPGFTSAQYGPKREIARIGVADAGVGIIESFRRNRSPHYVDGMGDLDGIHLAIRPEISSTTHLPTAYGHSPNRGVGLSMMRELVAQSFGYMSMISGRAWWYQDGSEEPVSGLLAHGRSFQGTICAIAFQRPQIADHVEMLRRARIGIGLQTDDNMDSLFS